MVFVNKIGAVRSDYFDKNGGIKMRAVITVIGHDAVGILAKVSTKCSDYNANVIEVTQSVLQDMLVDISKLNKPFAELADNMTALGESLGLSIHTMHEDIFNCMHHI